MMDYSEKLQKCHGYLNALKEERRKVEMFQRELPLCLELVTRAIEGCKQQISGTTVTAAAATTTTECLNGQSECSEQTTSDGPVLEEFMPIKRSCSSEQAKEEDDDNVELESHNNSTKSNVRKSDWLRSVQLWNQTPDPPNTKEEHQINKPTKLSVVELKRNGGAFQPFKKEKAAPVGPAPTPAASACSSAEEAAAGGSGKEGGEGQPRKSRRCWSPELHRRFLNALQQLGGSHVATPKQIKELMKVDGLTNDEVKSHLQKYRLHTRRPTSAVHNSNTQAPQFVVVGGIWVPPPEYAAAATLTAAAKLASPAPAGLPRHQETAPLAQREREKLSGSHSEGGYGGRCNSSSTSSSTHTTTASQA